MAARLLRADQGCPPGDFPVPSHLCLTAFSRQHPLISRPLRFRFTFQSKRLAQAPFRAPRKLRVCGHMQVGADREAEPPAGDRCYRTMRTARSQGTQEWRKQHSTTEKFLYPLFTKNGDLMVRAKFSQVDLLLLFLIGVNGETYLDHNLCYDKICVLRRE